MERFKIVDFQKKFKLGFPIILFILFFDRLTKILVAKNMEIGQSIDVFGWFFRLTYVLNPNFAFSIRIGNYWIMLIMNLLALFILLFYFLKTKFSTIKIISLSMIISGAFGNNFDRIKTKEVVDFINLGTKTWRFAIFNVADSFISIGIVILIFSLLFLEKNENC